MDPTVATALIAVIPTTLLALATLISVIKGNNKLDMLHGVVDGKMSEMIKAIQDAAKMEGKVEAMAEQQKQAATPPATTVVLDRRTTKAPE